MTLIQSDDKNTSETLNLCLDDKNNELVKSIVEEENPQNVKDLISLFNLNHTKKQVLRMMTHDQLLDHIMSQMEQRVTLRGDQFSNRDLLDYMNAMSNAMEKAQKQISDVNAVPAIQINQQNNINISENNISSLNKESRKNIMNAVQEILSQINLGNLPISESNSVLDSNELSEVSDSIIENNSETIVLNDENEEI